MMTRKIILIILISLFVEAVRAEKYDAYGLILKKVSLSIDEGGKILLDSIKNTEIKGSKYPISISFFADSIINASFTLHATHINLTIDNNIETSIYAMWSDCEFITFNGNIFPILTSGVRLIDKDQPLPSTRIRKEATFKKLF